MLSHNECTLLFPFLNLLFEDSLLHYEVIILPIMEIINTFLTFLAFFINALEIRLSNLCRKYLSLNHNVSIIHFSKKCYNFSLFIFLRKTYENPLFPLDCTHIRTISIFTRFSAILTDLMPLFLHPLLLFLPPVL